MKLVFFHKYGELKAVNFALKKLKAINLKLSSNLCSRWKNTDEHVILRVLTLQYYGEEPCLNSIIQINKMQCEIKCWINKIACGFLIRDKHWECNHCRCFAVVLPKMCIEFSSTNLRFPAPRALPTWGFSVADCCLLCKWWSSYENRRSMSLKKILCLSP